MIFEKYDVVFGSCVDVIVFRPSISVIAIQD
jgi:hypothetical protein